VLSREAAVLEPFLPALVEDFTLPVESLQGG